MRYIFLCFAYIYKKHRSTQGGLRGQNPPLTKKIFFALLVKNTYNSNNLVHTNDYDDIIINKIKILLINIIIIVSYNLFTS